MVNMDNNKDILDALSSVTDNLGTELGIDENNVPTSFSFYCDALTDENINSVIEDANSYLITLVGFPEVGKSTFVASLYHLLMLKGEINGFKIVDSDTYVGFERRAHVRNEVFKTSKRNARTVMTEGHFLTLTLCKDNIKKKLIISDKAGEIYKNNYVDNLSEIKNDKGLIYTKHILFFLDSSVLSDDFEYQDFDDKFQMLLGRMVSAKVFDIPKQFDILYNKNDTIEADEKNSSFKKNCSDFEEKLRSDFNIKVGRIFKTISNNIDDKGLQDVFDYFVELLEKKQPAECREVNWVNTLLGKNK